MPFTLSDFENRRPLLYHLTHAENLSSIRSARQLLPAAILEPEAVRSIRRRRPVVPGKPILRDQDLLHPSCIAFQDGWSLDDLLEDLGARVFFWAGRAEGPVRAGRRAFALYRATDVVIRVPFADVAARATPWFARCNSGATRMQMGKPVPRGPQTSQPAESFALAATDVVEVTFREPVPLPPTASWARDLGGPWETL